MTTLRLLLLPLLLLLTPVALRAEPCEILLAQIDAKIREGGATNFTLMTVDADSTDAGRVIGTCGMGRKKILYTSVSGSSRSTLPTLPSGATMGNPTGLARARSAAVMTECKAGYTGPDCSQRRVAPSVELKKPAP